MVWVRLDDHFPDHPKVVAAGPCAAWLYVCGIAYSNRHLTDGFIPVGVAHRLTDYTNVAIFTGGNEIAGPMDDVSCEWMAAILCNVGLWREVDGGYAIHDYLDFQPSKADVLALKDIRSEAGRRGGKASSRAKSKQTLKQNSSKPPSKREAKGQAESNPEPVPRPEPTPSEGSSVSATQTPSSSYDPSYEATILAIEQDREASRYIERDDDGEPLKIHDIQKLGGALA